MFDYYKSIWTVSTFIDKLDLRTQLIHLEYFYRINQSLLRFVINQWNDLGMKFHSSLTPLFVWICIIVKDYSFLKTSIMDDVLRTPI